jgi:hypothetical protein
VLISLLYARVVAAEATFAAGQRSHFRSEDGRIARCLAWDVHKRTSINAA